MLFFLILQLKILTNRIEKLHLSQLQPLIRFQQPFQITQHIISFFWYEKHKIINEHIKPLKHRQLRLLNYLRRISSQLDQVILIDHIAIWSLQPLQLSPMMNLLYNLHSDRPQIMKTRHNKRLKMRIALQLITIRILL